MAEYILRISPNSNATGPFDVYTGDTSITAPVYSSATFDDMIVGVTLDLPGSPTGVIYQIYVVNLEEGCDDNFQQQVVLVTETTTLPITPTVTPTNTPTPSITPSITLTQTPGLTSTPTPSVTPTLTVTPSFTPSSTSTPTPTPSITSSETPTPTPTVTPTITPSATPNIYRAYLFPEPQSTSALDSLSLYMYYGGKTWYGWGVSGVPPVSNFADNMDYYAHFSGFTNGSTGDFVTPVQTLNSLVYQTNTTDTFGCSVNQYEFGTIELNLSQVNTAIKYFYTLWIPLEGMNNTMSNLTINIGTVPCGGDLGSNLIPDSLRQINVNVTAGAAIPAGTYRVLWIDPNMNLPLTAPLVNPLYFVARTYTP
jgi:hypothetical protein